VIKRKKRTMVMVKAPLSSLKCFFSRCSPMMAITVANISENLLNFRQYAALMS